MRFLKPLTGAVLVLSLLLNVVLIYKIRGRRSIITVDGAPISRSDMDGYLEQAYGPQYKAAAVQRLLVDQEAHQQGVAPTDAEVQEEFESKQELDWSYAQRISRAPWLIDDAKSDIKMLNEEEHLLAKEIPVTDEEIREEYQMHPQIYDTPNKAKCTVAAILNEARTMDVEKMLKSAYPPYNAPEIAANYPREVTFLGYQNHYTFVQPFNTSFNTGVFTMKVHDVKVEAPGNLAQLGAKRIVIRMDEIIPGKAADLTDPKTVKNIKLHVQLHRAKPASELLASLWGKANIVFDDPNDKTNIEAMFFPEKARPK